MRRAGTRWIGALAGVVLLMAAGCGDESGDRANGSSAPPAAKPGPAPSAAPTPERPAAGPDTQLAETRTPAEMIEAGRGVYNGNCTACHASNPAMDGALGPAVAGSSPELLEARVLHGEYPEGYTPKRKTRVMVALPHLEPKLPELAAYLGSL